MHGVFADTQSRNQFATTPVRRSVPGLLSRGRQYPGPQPRRQRTIAQDDAYPARRHRNQGRL